MPITNKPLTAVVLTSHTPAKKLNQRLHSIVCTVLFILELSGLVYLSPTVWKWNLADELPFSLLTGKIEPRAHARTNQHCPRPCCPESLQHGHDILAPLVGHHPPSMTANLQHFIPAGKADRVNDTLTVSSPGHDLV